MPEQTVTLVHYADSFTLDPRTGILNALLDDNNLGWIVVTREWAERASWKCGYPNLEAFLDDYTADTTDHWIWDASRDGALRGFGWGTPPDSLREKIVDYAVSSGFDLSAQAVNRINESIEEYVSDYVITDVVNKVMVGDSDIDPREGE